MKTDHFPYNVGIPVYGLDFLSDSQIVVGGGGGAGRSGVKNKICVYSINTLEGKLEPKYQLELSKDEDSPMALASSESEKVVLAGINSSGSAIKEGKNADLRLFRFKSEEIVFEKSVKTISSTDDNDHEKVIVFNSTYDKIAVGSTDGSFVVLGFPSLSPIFSSNAFKTDIYDADFSEDGTTIAAISSNEVLILDAKTGKTIQNIERPTIHSKDDPCIFRAGKYGRGNTSDFFYTIINAKSKTRSFIVKWDINTWKRAGFKVASRNAITTFDRSPDGRFLAFATSDYSISIIDAHSLRSLISISNAHGFAITTLKFNKASSALVSGSVDATVRVIKIPLSFNSSFNTIIIVFLALLFVLIGFLVQIYLIKDMVK